MAISPERSAHALAVARKMRLYSMNNPGKCSFGPEEAFIVGLLHDIGYEFTDIQEEHAHKGGLILKAQAYQYWREIYYHGIPQTEYDSAMLRLLNYTDMTTSPSGEDMTIQERIRDISVRYGKESKQERDAIALASMLIDFK